MTKKILEIKGEDWMKGFSTQAGLASNGIFQSMVSFNPFERMGYLQPALAATELTAPYDAVKCITSWNSSGVGYFYAHTATKLYEYLVASPYTQSNKSAEIVVTQPIGGAIVWKSKYIYAQCTGGVAVYSNTLPVASGSNTEIMTNASSAAMNIRKMCIGADGNLYIGDLGGVMKMTNPNGTSGNSVSGVPAFAIDTGYAVRDVLNDGRYLVILADNNAIVTTSRVVGAYSCRVYFWDMVKGTADAIWDISDSYLIGGAFLNDKIYIFGYNGIYVCNLVTSPKMIWDFRGNTTIAKRPSNPYQIAVGSEDIFWADGGTNGQRIFALRGTTFYSPYSTHESTEKHTAISIIADTIVAATDAPKIYIHNVGSTRANASIQTSVESLPQPYNFSYAKVTLKAPMASGEAVGFNAWNSNGVVIVDTSTRSYATDGAKKVLTFRASPTSGSVTQFEDIFIQLNPQGGAVIERVSVYGEPSSDHLQQ